MVGSDGLTDSVVKAVDAALTAHGLVKVRVFARGKRVTEARGDMLFTRACQTLAWRQRIFLPQAREDAPVLLYLHGARWDVRGSSPRMRRARACGISRRAMRRC